MEVKLIVLDQRKAEPALKILGMSGKLYTFRWDKEEGYYVYTTGLQKEINDITELQIYGRSFTFSVLVPQGSPEEVKSTEPEAAAPEKASLPFNLNEIRDLTRDQLKDICEQLCLTHPKAAKDQTLRELIKAYSLGFSGVKISLLEPA